MRKLFLAVFVLLLLLAGIVLFNAFGVKPWPSTKAAPLAPLPDSALSHMSEAIRIPTVSPEGNQIDSAPFLAYRSFMQRSYPLLHQHLVRTSHENYSYAYTWKGTDSSLSPIILVAHYDVVPVEASAVRLWTAQPFGGEIKDSAIWGRGAIDDKASMISILEAAESLLQQGFTPRRTILLCFGHNEESSGSGAKAIVAWLQQQRLRAELVIDEGGEITTNRFKDVKRPIAMIGVGEKGYVTFDLTVEKPGGHSSKPDAETSIDILAKALVKLRSVPTPRHITPPIKELLLRISGSSDNTVNKIMLNNLWLFEGRVKSQLAAEPDSRAMISTTIVPTIIESGVRENVVPSNAKAIVNSRILPGETYQEVEAFVRHAIGDDRVKIRIAGDFANDPSATTDAGGIAFKKVEQAASAVMDDIIPAPFIMLGATDSRAYRAISDGVINFCPLTDSKGFHGIDERLPIKDFQRAISFYKILIKDSL
ncbi:MAG TPA: M20/M25/M40 family metallo-hydrolase [Puia sp.]|nr:M20/M25/M40 family metallo-hydrolase [Puia sp.]